MELNVACLLSWITIRMPDLVVPKISFLYEEKNEDLLEKAMANEFVLDVNGRWTPCSPF